MNTTKTLSKPVGSVVSAFSTLKNVIGLTLLASIINLSVTPAMAALPGDKITALNVVAVLEKNAEVAVTETIDVDFGKNQHHGIYRIIPLSTQVKGRKMSCKIFPQWVSCDRVQVHYDVSFENEKIKIKIGDSDTLLSGRHSYKIGYQVRGAVRLSKNNPELYWNAIGSDWDMPIVKAKVSFIAPSGVDPMKVPAKSFVGPWQAVKNGTLKHTLSDVEFFASNLKPGEGLTIACQLPENSVKIPGLIDELTWNMQQGALLAASAIALVMGMWPLALALIVLFIFRGSNVQNANWNSSGGSSLDFGSSGGGFGGGGGGTW